MSVLAEAEPIDGRMKAVVAARTVTMARMENIVAALREAEAARRRDYRESSSGDENHARCRPHPGTITLPSRISLLSQITQWRRNSATIAGYRRFHMTKPRHVWERTPRSRHMKR